MTAGHAALPGGKADSAEETPCRPHREPLPHYASTDPVPDQIARREAWEEIGLPMDDAKLPAPFRIEHLCYLPMNLARTELVVRPCVALLHATPAPISTSSVTAPTTTPQPTVEETLIPRLDPKEVAAVFSASFHNFLRATDEPPPPPPPAPSQSQPHPRPLTYPPGTWYEGSWTNWHDHPWRMHFFHVPVTNQRVARPRVREGGLAALGEEGLEGAQEAEPDPGRYKVWGMTAQILVDAACAAYGERPEFEHHASFVDERIIAELDRMGRFDADRKKDGQGGGAVTVEDMRKAVGAAAGNGQGGGGAKM